MIGPKAEAKSNALTFDEFTPKSAGEVALGLGKAAVSGIDKGVAGLAGAPADIAGFIQDLVTKGQSKVQGRPLEEVQAENDKTALISRGALEKWGSKAAHSASPLRYDPQTTPEKYVQSGAEFVPSALLGPGNMARNAVALGVGPGLASEAAGQATEGTAYEPWARAGAAIAGGVAGHWATAPNAAGAAVSRGSRGANQAQIDEAERLFEYAQGLGLPITRAEAVQHVTGGATNLGNLQRVVEGSGELRPFMAARPGQVDDAARQAFDTISPPPLDPSQIGSAVGETARQIMRQSPEGEILADTLWRAGPRITPERAGNVIQQDLSNVYDRREGMRAALADQDYTAARNAPATIPTNGGHRVADVTTHYLDRPDIPIILDPAERAAAKGRWFDDNNPTTRMPIVGERPTEFAQVNSGPVLEYIDAALDTAKGAVRQGLQAAKSALMRPDGTLDTSVAGLHNSRVAIDDLISQAKLAGANQTVMRLQEAKQVLDQTLERVPSYGKASENFRAASQPLNAFDKARVPGQIIERDQFNNRFVMPPERAPGAIQNNGPSAVRDFNSVASQAAREAFEQNLVTQVLDQATKKGADLSTDAIRKALLQNADILRQYPGVRDRLESVAIARDGLARIEQTPIGHLAKRDLSTKKAIAALFPENPLPRSAGEIGSAIEALAKQRPQVAQQLVRTHVESVFNEAVQRLQSGANEFGGAGFVAVLRGNPQQAANLEAAVTALRGGQAYQGFDRFLNVLEAQGSRQRIGSQTAFNQEVQAGLKTGGTVAEALSSVASGGLKLPSKINQRIEQWRMGGNVAEIADLLTNPAAAQLFRQLATAPTNSAKAGAIVARLTYLGTRAREE
ncbi:hypothetical protein [Bradyrhizobium sp.]|uniref:hypothetical protein n=1 Tax=Bradyrhizobium sp. TaxID=376 RepID=UPI0025BE9E15|nr:hypothetical protein [Bradyrhizobium sp.]